MNPYITLAEKLAERFEKEKAYLCELDRRAGDGDHGMTMARGFEEACRSVAAMSDETAASEICKEIGYAMLRSMGGASGPIFSTFFIQASILLRGKQGWDQKSFADTINAAIESICDFAGTQRYEKTMLDALYGAKDALDEKKSANMREVVLTACEGAKKGARSTENMIAAKGRAKYLGERSLGFMDAGSCSISFIFEVIAEVFGGM